MNKRFLTRTWTLLTAIMVLSVGLNAGVITGNFCSVATVDNPADAINPAGPWAGQPVGLNTGPNQWFNDLTQDFDRSVDPDVYLADDYSTGANVATPGVYHENLFYTDGTAAPDDLRIDWTSTIQDNNDSARASVNDRHDQMMAGYLQAGGLNTPGIITLTGTNMGLAYGTYDIYLYIDGEDGQNEISTWTAALTGGATYYGEDTADYVTSGAGYSQVTSTTLGVYQAGNYVIFEDVSGDFEITITGTEHGVSLNGFEIVPEPSSFALLALLGCAGGLIRRRRSA